MWVLLEAAWSSAQTPELPQVLTHACRTLKGRKLLRSKSTKRMSSQGRRTLTHDRRHSEGRLFSTWTLTTQAPRGVTEKQGDKGKAVLQEQR